MSRFLGHVFAVAVLLLPASLLAQNISIVPRPLSFTPDQKSRITVNRDTAIIVEPGNQGAHRVAAYLVNLLRQVVSAELRLTEVEGMVGRNTILLTSKGADADLGPEGYEIVVSDGRLAIRSVGEAGLFYGVQSLRQLVPVPMDGENPGLEGRCTFLGMTLRDKPRFEWRGMMLDVARHFQGPETIRRYIDLLAMHKMNRLHLHLTDDQGWRIEIKRRPRLTTVGATGNHSDKEAPPVFLTQDEVRDLVAYGRARHVMLVPEIDMPGHCKAAVRAYPEIGIKGDNKVNPGRDAAYQFVEDVLTEVAELFDAPYVHIGGDEVNRKSWGNDPDVKAKMQELGLSNTKELEHHFTRTVAGMLERLNRRLMGWDEVADAGLPDSAVVHWWRHDKPAILDLAVARGQQVVCSPRAPAYFDYMQDPKHPNWGWRLLNTMEKVYKLDPVPASFDEKQAKQILGVQANVWTERIATVKKLDYMVFPRLTAMAEVGWTAPGLRDLESFRKRTFNLFLRYDAMGVNYYTKGKPFPRR